MAAGVSMTSPADPGRGLGVKQIFIRSVDAAADRVLGTDPNGAQIEVPYSICRVGRWPSPGETWIVDRVLGFWSLAAFIGLPDPPDVDPAADWKFHGAAHVVDLGGGLMGARFAHGAAFTPSGGVPVSYDGGSVSSSYTFQIYSLDPVYLTVEVVHSDGTAATVGEAVECFAVVWP